MKEDDEKAAMEEESEDESDGNKARIMMNIRRRIEEDSIKKTVNIKYN